MRGEHLVAIGLALIAGCSWTTSSTERGTTFGYDRPVRVAVMTHGQSDVIEGWIDALRAAGNIEMISSSALVGDLPDELAARMCKQGRELAAAGTPVDEVVALRTTETVDARVDCKKWKHTKRFLDRLAHGDDGVFDAYCVKSKYVSTSAHVSASIDFLDVATCRLTRSRTEPSGPGGAATGDEAADRATARQIAAQHHVQKARLLAPTLFPRGLSIVGVNGRQIEVSRRGQRELAPGELYVVRGQPPGPAGNLGRVRVASVAGDRAILEAERDYVGVGVGDELRVHTVGHRWTFYGTLTAGQVKDDLGTATSAGFGAAVRWTPERIPVIAEAEAVWDFAPATDVGRLSVGPAAGLRWPVGPFGPYAIVELGISQQSQRDTAGRPAIALGTYRGAGAGTELRFGRAFVLGDVRYRRLTTSSWKTDEEMPAPTTVPHPDLRVTHVLARVAAGFQF